MPPSPASSEYVIDMLGLLAWIGLTVAVGLALLDWSSVMASPIWWALAAPSAIGAVMIGQIRAKPDGALARHAPLGLSLIAAAVALTLANVWVYRTLRVEYFAAITAAQIVAAAALALPSIRRRVVDILDLLGLWIQRAVFTWQVILTLLMLVSGLMWLLRWIAD